LVVKIAREYAGRRSDLLDLVQEGNIGLLEGIRRFDPGRGTRLTTYAGWWIRAYVIKHVMDNARLVRWGRTRAQRAAFMRGELPPSEVSMPDDETSALERGWNASERPDEIVESRDATRALQESLDEFRAGLDARDEAILDERLLSETPQLRRELGRRLAITGERVRQLEANLVHRLSRHMGAMPAASAALA
jgi:RNA polymerase sigma-32 factor